MKILSKVNIIFMVFLLCIQLIVISPVFAVGTDQSTDTELNPESEETIYIPEEEFGDTEDGINYNYDEYDDFLGQFDEVCSYSYYYDEIIETQRNEMIDRYEYITIDDNWGGWSDTNYYTNGYLSAIQNKSNTNNITNLLVDDEKQYRYRTRNKYKIYTLRTLTGYTKKTEYKFKQRINRTKKISERVWSSSATRKWEVVGLSNWIYSKGYWSSYKGNYTATKFKRVQTNSRKICDDPLSGCRTEYYYKEYYKTDVYGWKYYGGYIYIDKWVDDSYTIYKDWTSTWYGSPWVKTDQRTVNDKPIYIESESQTNTSNGGSITLISERDAYTGWTSYGGWGTSVLSESDTRERESRTAYRKKAFTILPTHDIETVYDQKYTLDYYQEEITVTDSETIRHTTTGETKPLDGNDWKLDASKQAVCTEEYSFNGVRYRATELLEMYLDRSPRVVLSSYDDIIINVGETYELPTCTAKDTTDKDLSCNAPTGVPLDTSKPGIYSIEFTATDSDMNVGFNRVKLVIEVPDETPPVITLNGDSVVSLIVNETFDDPSATCVDDVDDKCVVDIIPNVNYAEEGIYYINYTAMDEAGNREVVQRRIYIDAVDSEYTWSEKDVDFSQIISTALTTVKDNVVNFFEGMIKGVAQYFIDAWNTVKAVFTKLGEVKDTAIEFFNQLLSDPLGFFNSMFRGIVDLVVNVVSDALELGKLVGNIIIEKIIEAFTGGVAKALNLQSAGLLGLFPKLNNIDELADTAKVLDKIEDALDGPADTIVSKSDDIIDSLDNQIDDAVRGATEFIDDAGEELVEEISEKLSRSIDELIEAGKLSVVKNADGSIKGWQSSGGLLYDMTSLEGNRVKHVLVHAADSGVSGKSLFNVTSNNVLELVDDAWKKRGTSYMNKGNEVFEIFMDDNVVGTVGQKYIRIVVRPGTSEILSSYPIKALVNN